LLPDRLGAEWSAGQHRIVVEEERSGDRASVKYIDTWSLSTYVTDVTKAGTTTTEASTVIETGTSASVTGTATEVSARTGTTKVGVSIRRRRRRVGTTGRGRDVCGRWRGRCCAGLSIRRAGAGSGRSTAGGSAGGSAGSTGRACTCAGRTRGGRSLGRA